MAGSAVKKATQSTQVKKARNSPEALLDALHFLMVERRSLDVAIADISDRSGLNTGLVRYYFKSKNGMLLALLDRIAGLPIRNLNALIDAPMSATEKLKRHLTGLINLNHRYPYPLLFVTMLFLGKINRWRQRAFEQAECLRCVYFIAWDREACGFDGGARTFSGTAALAMSGRA
jgi:TetR/AcrR family transcriptional regulator